MIVYIGDVWELRSGGWRLVEFKANFSESSRCAFIVIAKMIPLGA